MANQSKASGPAEGELVSLRNMNGKHPAAAVGGARGPGRTVLVASLLAAALIVCGPAGSAGRPTKAPAKRPRYAFTVTVVDDKTGKPVEDFALQRGWVNPGAANRILWGHTTYSPRGHRGGKLNVGWDAITGNYKSATRQFRRIVANGYLPHPISTKPITDPAPFRGLVIRLKRGRQVQGRVVDHAGKPAAGAKLFLRTQGGGVLNIRDRSPESNFFGTTATADADGRFAMTGLDDAATHVAVMTETLDCWLAKVPAPGKEMAITLPAPARVIVHFDIPGAAGEFRFDLMTWEMPQWKGLVGTSQTRKVANGGKLTIEGLTPGVYDVFRLTMVRVGTMGQGWPCDRRKVTLEAGKTTEIRFVRKGGIRLDGHVVGLQTAGVRIDPGAFIFVKSPGATGDRFADRKKETLFDMTKCGLDGAFQTPLLKPGRYTVIAEAYAAADPNSLSTGFRRAALIGTADVTIPASGRPPHVVVIVGPRADKSKGSTKPPAPAAKLPPAPANLSPAAAKRHQKLQQLWQDLASTSPTVALATITALAAAGDHAVPFIADRLALTPPSPKQLSKLLADLDDEKYAVRTAAHAALSKLGRAAAAALTQTLKAPKLSAEVRSHVRTLLADLARPQSLDQGRQAERAVLVLTRIATPKARAILTRMAQSEPQEHVKALAKAMLATLQESATP